MHDNDENILVDNCTQTRAQLNVGVQQGHSAVVHFNLKGGGRRPYFLTWRLHRAHGLLLGTWERF